MLHFSATFALSTLAIRNREKVNLEPEIILIVAKPATVGRYYFLKQELFEENIPHKWFVTFQNLQCEPCKFKAIGKIFFKVAKKLRVWKIKYQSKKGGL